MEDKKTKGGICVTGGSGFLGSWIVKRLLEDGYYVNATTRIDPDRGRDISYLTNLPGASERLKIFNADLDKPESFRAAIDGCEGVFHTAHPLDLEEKESEERKTKRVIGGVHGILQACVDSKTVKRVVYTSSLTVALFSGSELIDENSWADVDRVRRSGVFLGPYVVTKTLTEKAAFDFAAKNGLDLVSVLPTWITGDEKHYSHLKSTCMVHVDDVARAHIHFFEHPNAEGRYLCTGVDTSIEEMCELISTRYPEYQLPNTDSWKDIPIALQASAISSEKLVGTGFKFENGLEEMLDGAIKCCKEKGYF